MTLRTNIVLAATALALSLSSAAFAQFNEDLGKRVMEKCSMMMKGDMPKMDDMMKKCDMMMKGEKMDDAGMMKMDEMMKTDGMMKDDMKK